MSAFMVETELRQKLLNRVYSLNAIKNPQLLDCIVTHCEINERQGVGILLQRIGGVQQNFLTIRSHDLYGGVQQFGTVNLCIQHSDLDRLHVLSKVSQSLAGSLPKRILSVPYFKDDVLNTIALKDLYDVPLCTFLMDDQNIYSDNIPDDYIRELLNRSDLCLGISRELCQAYQEKYQKQFWWLPPVIPGQFLQAHPLQLGGDRLTSKRGIIIGNIWSLSWLERLRKITAESGIHLDWYGKPNRDWFQFREADLERDGIRFRGFLPEVELIHPLHQMPYAVVPTGSGDDDDDRPEIAKLSLPSRISFLTAAGNIPIIVVGRRDSVAARFVEDFEIGVVCDYDAEYFRRAVDYVCTPRVQAIMRDQSAKLAAKLSAEGIGNWVWRSLNQKHPVDLRFENLKNTERRLFSAVHETPFLGGKLTDASVIVTLNENNERHGTGALVTRIFGGTPHIFSIRSQNHYGGEQQFGDVQAQVRQGNVTRAKAFQNIATVLRSSSVKRAFCVPYASDDLISSIAIRDMFNVPLGTYIMDDQNIVVKSIPDDLMSEFLSKCSIRFGTHPELRDAYEAKFNLKFYLLPAIVPAPLIHRVLRLPDPGLVTSRTGALLGSMWSQQWFSMLCNASRGANLQLDWFGNYQYHWMKETPEDLKKKGVHAHGILPESLLGDRLKSYPFVIVPTGTLDERDDRPELSKLSLPGRIIFAMASSGTPIIIMGSRKTGAARFIERFKIGVVCDYDANELRAAVDYVMQPEMQLQMRKRALAAASGFSAEGIREWVWRSLEKGEAADNRFEQLFPALPNSVE